jgi:copper(I)-binding protein
MRQILSDAAEKELTMRKLSTLSLVVTAVAGLVAATIAHAWLLSPDRPVHHLAGGGLPMVTIVPSADHEASNPPVEIASRATRHVEIAQAVPHEGRMKPLFGPRTLPLWRHSFGWRDASIHVETQGGPIQGGSIQGGPGAGGFAAVAADTAGITCEQVWARPTAGAGTTGAAYFTLTNNGPPDELVGASTPVAASASVHETTDDHGVMRMRPVASLPLAPGKPVLFRPGSYHLMLIGLKAPLKVGDSFPVTLSFAHAQPVTVKVKVQTGPGMGGATMPGMH